MANDEKQSNNNPAAVPAAGNTRAQVAGAFGKPVNMQMPAGAVDTSTLKNNVLSFSDQGVYLSLRTVSEYDEKTQTRKPAVPRITCSIGGTFVQLPMNGKFWRSFADFVDKIARSMDKVDISTARISDDVDSAIEIMSQYRNVE